MSCIANVQDRGLCHLVERPTGADHDNRAAARIWLAALPPCVSPRWLLLLAAVAIAAAAGCGSGESDTNSGPQARRGADGNVADQPVQLSPLAWNAKLDPSAESFTLSRDPALEVELSVTYPTLDGPGLLFGSAHEKGLTSYDLAQGQVIGQLEKQEQIVAPPIRISPDGRWIAFRETGFPTATVKTWNMATQQLGKVFSVSDQRIGEWLDFTSNDELCTVARAADSWDVGVWKVDTGEAVAEFDVPHEANARFMAATISPGGRYLAIADDCWLQMFEARKGACVGRVRVPQTWRGFNSAYRRLAFRRDGSALAGVATDKDVSKIAVWDAVTGEIKVEENLPGIFALRETYSNRYDNANVPLASLPGDGDWLLFGAYIVDHQTGELTGTLEPDVRFTRRVLADGKMLVLKQRENTRELILNLVDPEQLTAEALAATLPQVKRWEVQVDPSKEYASRGIPQSPVIRYSRPGSFCFSSRPSPYVAMRHDGGFNVYAIDEKSQRTGEIKADEIPPCTLGDVSPDGMHLTISTNTDVQVWSVEEGRSVWSRGKSRRGAAWECEFLSPTEVSVLTDYQGTRQLEVWDTQQKKVTRQFEFPREAGQILRGSWATSPGGRYGACIQGTGLSVYDLATGESVGQSTWTPRSEREYPQHCAGIAFSTDGRRLAAIISFYSRHGASDEPDSFLCWDVTTGKLLVEKQLGGFDIAALEEKYKLYSGAAFEGIPNSGDWLLRGHAVLNDEGGFVESLPETDWHPRKLLDREHILAYRQVSGTAKWSLGLLGAPDQQLASDEPDDSDVVYVNTWNAVPDPSTTSIAPAESIDLELPVGYYTVRHSARPSPFVLVASEEAYRIHRLDQPDEAPVTLPRNNRSSERRSDISPDGRFFTTLRNGSDTLDVWSTEESKVVYGYAPRDGRLTHSELLGGAQILIVWQSSARGVVLEVHDLEQRKLVRSIDCNHGVDYGGICVSPGGRYALAYAQGILYCYDLTTGDQAGEADVEGEGGRLHGCAGMVFSPDGTQLAMLLKEGDAYDGTVRFLCLDFATGAERLRQQFSIRQLTDTDDRVLLSGADNLAALPDGKGWVAYWRSVIDATDGSIGCQLPPFPNRGCKFLDSYRVLFVDSDEENGSRARRLAIADTSGQQLLPLTIAKWDMAKPADVAVAQAGKAAPSANIPSDVPFWHAQADPPAVVHSVNSAEPHYVIPLPKRHHVRLADEAGDFAAVAATDRNLVARYNIRSGEVSGTIDIGGNIDYERTYLSPDGRFFAAYPASNSQSLHVWAFETGRLESRIDVGSTDIDFVRFVAENRVVTFRQDTYVEGRIWDIASRRTVAEFTLDQPRVLARLEYLPAVSPGGRYAVVLTGRMLHVWEMSSGKLVGRSYLPHTVSSGGRYAFDAYRCSCYSLEFTPEGDELVALYTPNHYDLHMMRWDFKTGQPAAYQPYGQKDASDFDRDHDAWLDWLPGRSLFVCDGGHVVDHQTLKRAHTIEDWNRKDVVRVLDLQRLLVQRANKERNGDELATVQLPAQEIITAVKDTRATAKQTDLPTKPTVVAAVQTITPPTGSVRWSAGVDPREAPAKPSVDRFPISLMKTPDRIRMAADLGLAYVFTSAPAAPENETEAVAANSSTESTKRIDIFDLTSGQLSRQLVLGIGEKFHDISPDGSLVLMQSSALAQDRLDIWSVDSNSHAASWIPARRTMRESGDIAWAAFVDKRQVLALCSGQMMLWQLPECRLMYKIEDFGNVVALSPGRRYAVGTHAQRGCQIFDTRSGQCVGSLSLPPGVEWTGTLRQGAAVSGDGRSLLALHGSLICVWDMATGKLKQHFTLVPQAQAQRCHWLDDRYVFFYDGPLGHRQFLVDLKNRAAVRQYDIRWATYGIHAEGVTDGRQWYTTRVSPRDGRVQLVGARLPLDEERAECEATTLESQAVAYPGVSVAVSANNQTAYDADISSALRRAAEASGLVVKQQAPLRLVGTMTEEVTGYMVVMFGRVRDDKQNFPVKRVHFECQLLDASGRQLWKGGGQYFSMHPSNTEEGTLQEVERRLKNEVQQMISKRFAKGIHLDEVFFTHTMKLEIPKSRLPGEEE